MGKYWRILDKIGGTLGGNGSFYYVRLRRGPSKWKLLYYGIRLLDSNFVLGNAQAEGHPIVYCSDGFCELTGYPRAQIMAKSCCCLFLCGKETEESEKEKIKDALANQIELKTEVLHYRKNGHPYWCLLDIVPIKNEKSQVVMFLVSNKDITREKSSLATDDSGEIENDDDNLEAHPRPRTRFQLGPAFSGSNESLGNGSPGNASPSKDTEKYNKYQRRRSRAVLYQLSGQFEKQNKAKSKLQHLNKFHSLPGTNPMPEYKVEEVKSSRFIILHYGIFKIGWDWLILLCTFYVAIMVPFNAAFITQDGRHSIYADVVVEVLFAIDIVLNFRTSFVSKSGQVVVQPHLIALNYIRGWFLLDLLAAIPFDILYILNIETASGLIHLLKVARLLRLARLLQKIERFSQYSAIIVALMMMMFALVGHWLACIWYAIGKEELNQHPSNWSVGWLYELSERLGDPIYNKTNIPNLFSSYVASLYFTFSSLTSVGFGNVSANTNKEKIFSICAMLVGAMMHAVVFGNVTAIIQRMYARRAHYHSRTKDLKDFFRTHHLPKHLKQRMTEYFQTMWSFSHGIDIGEILKDFPEEMRGEIAIHLNQEILGLPIFETATQGCLKAISLQVRRNFCAPGEYLLHKGDAVNYVYFLCSGSMEILKDDIVVAILGKGDLFGTDLNYNDLIIVTSCDVKSLTYCELQCLNIKGLVENLLQYPEFAEQFANDIQHDLTYNLRNCPETDDNTSTKDMPVITLPAINEDDEEDEDDSPVESPAKDESPNEVSEDDDNVGNSEPAVSPPFFSRLKPIPNGHIENFSSFSRNAQRSVLSSSKWFGFDKREDPLPMRSRVQTDNLRRVNSYSGTKHVRFNRNERRMTNSLTAPSLNQPRRSVSDESLIAREIYQELEGTRNSMDNLDKRINMISHEVVSISHDMKSILKALQNIPMSPMGVSEASRPSFDAGQRFTYSITSATGETALKTGTSESGSAPSGASKHSATMRTRNLLHLRLNRSSNKTPPRTTDSQHRYYKNGDQRLPDMRQSGHKTRLNSSMKESRHSYTSPGKHQDVARRHSDGASPDLNRSKMDTLCPKLDLGRRHSDSQSIEAENSYQDDIPEADSETNSNISLSSRSPEASCLAWMTKTESAQRAKRDSTNSSSTGNSAHGSIGGNSDKVYPEDVSVGISSGYQTQGATISPKLQMSNFNEKSKESVSPVPGKSQENSPFLETTDL